MSKFNRSAKPFVFLSLVLFALALIVYAGSQSQSSRGILIRPAPGADHLISYGNDPQQFGELRLPKSAGPHPVAIIIHGGCWMAEYGLSYMSHLSASLTEAGVATWSIEYRRIGNTGGGWPGTFQDVARGADHLRALAKTYPLDLGRVVVVGHSAGGHLALWLAARKKLATDTPLYQADPISFRGVIPLAAITDLRKTGTACDGSVEKLIEGTMYSQTSPIELLPLGNKQTIVQGETDNIVPQSMAKDYVEAAKRKGEEVKLVVIEGAGHFEVVDPKSSAWPRVKEEILVLLKIY